MMETLCKMLWNLNWAIIFIAFERSWSFHDEDVNRGL
jgi:hypothetical protein